jgi:hypothetical protein
MSWLSQLFSRKPAAVPNLWSGSVLTHVEFQALLGAWEPMADQSYAVINSAALPDYYRWFRETLKTIGVLRWDEKFDCDNFARMYADLMAARFYGSLWEAGSTTPKAESPAVAVFWYRPKCGQTGHAIVRLSTDKGLIAIEPQTGAILPLTDDEIASRYRTIA